MSAIVYLLRHGVAEVAGDGISDAERRLTEQGGRQIRQIACALRTISACPNLILSSPLVRARQTAAIVAQTMADGVEAQVLSTLAPAHPPEEIVRSLEGHRRADSLLLVGHQPGLGELASYLLTGSSGLVPLPFKPGAVAAIAVGSLAPQSPGELLWFLTPEQLCAIRS